MFKADIIIPTNNFFLNSCEDNNKRFCSTSQYFYYNCSGDNGNVHSVIGRDVHHFAQESPRAC